MSDITRRQILTQLAAAIVAARTIDRLAAQEVHQMASEAAGVSGPYKPVSLSAHEYASVERLADLIIPVENGKPGALQAGVPAWIDMLTGVNDQLKATYTKGVTWLDAAMTARGAKDFVTATPAQQTALLDVIAYRKNSTPDVAAGIEFFTWVRRMTVDGFYTSRIGMRDIYLGNTPQTAFVVPQEAIDYAVKRSGL
jgi:hypothetical protein